MKKIISPKKINYHKFFKDVIYNLNLNDYNWLVSDFEIYPFKNNEQIFFNEDYVLISNEELINILQSKKNLWVWAVLSAIPKKYKYEEVIKYSIPTCSINEQIFKNNIIQHPLSEIEIVVFDSSYAWIVSKNNKYIDIVKSLYPLSIVIE